MGKIEGEGIFLNKNKWVESRLPIYRVFTITGHTVYFTKRTGYLKMRYSRVFSLSEHNKHTKLHSQYGKN